MDDAMFRAYAIAALRSGEVTEEAIADAAGYADEQGDKDTAHQLRILILRANEAPQSEFTAQQRRRQMRVYDGGNSD